MTIENVWRYRSDVTSDPSLRLVGYEVEAVDGKVGTVDEDNNAVDDSYLVVDTGPWIFGKKVLLPAGVVERVDQEEQKIYVCRTKQEIKDAPEFDESGYRDTRYRDEVGGYYAHFPGTM